MILESKRPATAIGTDDPEHRTVRTLACGITIALLSASCGASSVAQGGPLPSPTPDAVQAVPAIEKGSRNDAQLKISSQLLSAIDRLRGGTPAQGVPPARSIVKLDEKNRALVDVRVEVTSDIQDAIAVLGGTMVATSNEFRSIVAWIPLLSIELLAKRKTVISIMPAAQPGIRR